jgi:hypothetical protein
VVIPKNLPTFEGGMNRQSNVVSNERQLSVKELQSRIDFGSIVGATPPWLKKKETESAQNVQNELEAHLKLQSIPE